MLKRREGQEKLKKVFFQKVLWQSQEQILVNEILQINKNKPNIQEIITARVVAKVLDQETLQDQTLIQGVTTITILYFANSQSQPIQTLHAQMDFDHAIAIPGIETGFSVQTDLVVENLFLELINPTTVETKILFKLLTKITTPDRDLEYPEIISPFSYNKDTKNFFWASAHYLN